MKKKRGEEKKKKKRKCMETMILVWISIVLYGTC